MEKNRKIMLNEMDRVTGGALVIEGCTHPKKLYTGEKKTENGVVLYAYKCYSCGTVIWTDEVPQAGGATGSW